MSKLLVLQGEGPMVMLGSSMFRGGSKKMAKTSSGGKIFGSNPKMNSFFSGIFSKRSQPTPVSLSGMCLLGGDGILDNLKSIAEDSGGAALNAAGAKAGQSIMSIFSSGSGTTTTSTPTASRFPSWAIPVGAGAGILLVFILISKSRST